MKWPNVNRALIGLCWACGFGLLAANFHLGQTNRQLGRELEAYRQASQLQPGSRAPLLAGTDSKGGQVAVDFAQVEGPTLVFVFSPTCPVCDDNWPLWDRLRARREGLNLIAVDLSGLSSDDYVEFHGLSNVKVLRQVEPRSILDYRLRFTPQTFVIRNNTVVAAWTGLLSRKGMDAIQSALDE